MNKSVVKILSVSILMFCVFAVGQVLGEPTTPAEMVADAKSQIMHVSVDICKMLFDTNDFAFIDVREPNETKMGFIPNAFLIPRGLLEFRIGSIIEHKDAKIVVYCKSGGRSALAALSLKKLGYANVISMDGGWKGWEEADYPIAE